MNDPTSIAGWIVRVEGRDVAAGPTRNAALRTAREFGYEGGKARPAGAREIDDLDLPDAALGITPETARQTDGAWRDWPSTWASWRGSWGGWTKSTSFAWRREAPCSSQASSPRLRPT